MAVDIPGLSLSILRQQTSVRAGLPLLVSGRFTAFGLGVPAFIRVSLEGPSYDPQIRSFDTFSSPFSGDYTVNVIAEKDGRYSVYAQAFPPPIIPTGPPFPDPILLLPPMAESTRPPLVVGFPFDGGVDALMPDGTSQRLTAPPMQPIEFRPLITVGAPGVTITMPGVGAVPMPALPWYPAVPAPPAPPVAPPVEARAAIDDILFSPPEINPGMEATGVMAWRNTGDAPQLFDIVFYLVSPVGVRYGPLQVNLEVSAHPQVPTAQNLRLSTEGMPSGFYSVVGEIYDITTGALIAARTLPNRLSIREIAPPVVPVPPPPVVPVPPPPVVPVTPAILGTPQLNLPTQVTVGDVWAGSVSLPTFGDVPFFGEASLVLLDPTGAEQIIAQGGRTLQPGEILQIPVNFDTTGFAAGDYTILLRVFDQMGSQIAEFPMGFLSMLEAIAPPVPPIPTIPTLPTADMFGTPSINLPTEVEIGEIWQGGVNIPTYAPPALMALPSLPSFPVNIGLQLQNPAGQLFDIGSWSPTFVPGQPINLPISFDTGLLPEPGMHNVVMGITDLQGNELFSNVIGFLDVLPLLAPPVPGLSEFPAIEINLGPSQVEVGQELAIPITYTHIGIAESVLLRASIGDLRAGIFDEVWHAEITVSVPVDASPTPRTETISVPITPKFMAAGLYTVEAKINHWRPRVLARLPNIVQVMGVPAVPVPPTPPPPPVPPAPPVAPSRFTSITVNLAPRRYQIGDTVTVPVTYIHVGRAQNVTLYAAVGQRRLGAFDEILHAEKSVSVPLDESPTPRSDQIRIPITPAISPGTYHVYAKIVGYPPSIIPLVTSVTVQNVVEVIGVPAPPPVPPPPVPPPLPPAEFSNVSVSYPTAPVRIGGSVSLQVSFVHSGQGESEWLYAAIGNDGIFGFDEILNSRRAITVPDEAQPTFHSEIINIPVTTAIRPGTYDVYAKIGLGVRPRAISTTTHDVIRITS